MKSILLGITLLGTTTNVLAAYKLVNIKLEYGKQSAFTKEEVMLQCLQWWCSVCA